MKLAGLPGKTARALGLVIICLTFINFALQLEAYLLHYPDNVLLDRLLNFFDPDRSGNLPGWYDVLTLLFSAGLLARLALSRNISYRAHWATLAAGFLYLSIDKALGIHGRWMAQLGMGLMDNNYYYGKALLVGGIALIFGLLYLKFFLNLPLKFRLLFAGATLTYLGGGLGLEMIEGIWIEYFGDGFSFICLTALENILEMSGILFLIYALLTYLEQSPSRLGRPAILTTAKAGLGKGKVTPVGE